MILYHGTSAQVGQLRKSQVGCLQRTNINNFVFPDSPKGFVHLTNLRRAAADFAIRTTKKLNLEHNGCYDITLLEIHVPDEWTSPYILLNDSWQNNCYTVAHDLWTGREVKGWVDISVEVEYCDILVGDRTLDDPDNREQWFASLCGGIWSRFQDRN